MPQTWQQIQAELQETIYPRYHAIQTLIVERSAKGVALLARRLWPDARYIAIEETDQDTSGSLVPDNVYNAEGNPVLPIDNELSDNERWVSWVDDAWPLISNLADDNSQVWSAYLSERVTPDGAQSLVLDIDKMLAIELKKIGNE